MEQARRAGDAANAPQEARRSPTLTEYALVAFLASALGMVAVPKKSDPPPQDVAISLRTRELESALGHFRKAIYAYLEDHALPPGFGPGAPDRNKLRGPAEEKYLIRQLTEATDSWGRRGPAWDEPRPLGPYLLSGIPENPVNGRSSVRVLEDDEPFPMEPDGSTGWIYKPITGQLRANCEGRSGHGDRSYYDL